MPAVLGAMVLLAMVLLGSSILMVMFVGNDEAFDEALEDRKELFGTVLRSMWTLFGCVIDGCHQDVMSPIVNFRPAFGVFFILYVMVTVFGLMNVIVAVFCETCMDISKTKLEMMETAMQAKKDTAYHALKKFWELTDVDGSRTLTKSEFSRAMQNNEVLECLAELGLQDTHAHELFHTMDVSQDGFISVEEFVKGLMQLKQHKTNVTATLLATRRIENSIRALVEGCCRTEELIQELHASKSSVGSSTGLLVVSANRDKVCLASSHSVAYQTELELGKLREPINRHSNSDSVVCQTSQPEDFHRPLTEHLVTRCKQAAEWESSRLREP
eukprot:gnl/MRDRNA2_/MRDRNA2_35514_c0_seq1.p1 gnl/MRDRNA2_/MRDRNA2_35514_c0~~gnl/MRDRNA2_/MRDRNA2_35514_c0_seq1.p1  ORF type:complete len:372 (-),score=38.98 gnl/MRDRNA2_/MRDRNA2_35514_c0_seq1:169-1155(-)